MFSRKFLSSVDCGAAGNRMVMTDSVGVTTYVYDDLGRLTSVDDPITGTVSYIYDLVGNRTQLVYPDGKVVTYTYDADNHLIEVEDWDEGLTSYEYDAAGRLVNTTLPNGVVSVNEYDAAGRLVNLTHTAADETLLSSYEYELDGLGNRVQVTETLTGTTRVIDYIYDPLNRLVSADYSTGESFEYAYDTVGNRTTMTTTAGTTSYQYDEANRLTSMDGVDYTWDDRGNLVSDGTFTYTYNTAGRMARAESITVTLVYTYNADGLRVAQSVDGSVTTFVWDWASGIPEMLSDGDNLYLVSYDTLGYWDGNTWTYHLPDALGSIRQITDAAGAVTDGREWTPFGVEVGSAQVGLGYTGEWHDPYTKFNYLRARWYVPGAGRFTQRDPSRLEANPYLYAVGNPILLTDPTGYFAEQLIADSLNLGDFKEVVRWFDQREEVSWGWTDEAKRWGFLALLQAADAGDRVTGLTLHIAGIKGEVGLGEFVSDGCAIRVLAKGRYYSLSEYVQQYLSDATDPRYAGIPVWRSAVHRYRLSGGEEFKDSTLTDLPDFFSVTFGRDVYPLAGWGGLGVGIEVGIASDRFGNDYVTGGGSLGAGVEVPPGVIRYSEGYVGGMVRQWGTGRAYQLNEDDLIGAMTGFDLGAGITFMGMSLSGDVGLNIPPQFQTATYSVELLKLLGVDILSVSGTTRPLSQWGLDIPFTKGWSELDAIRSYTRSDFP